MLWQQSYICLFFYLLNGSLNACVYRRLRCMKQNKYAQLLAPDLLFGHILVVKYFHLKFLWTVDYIKLWIYEIHIFELRNEEINVKKILAVNWANKSTGSWSLNWFVIYPGKMKLLNWLERCTGIAEVRVRIPASQIFSGFLFATT